MILPPLGPFALGIRGLVVAAALRQLALVFPGDIGRVVLNTAQY